MNAADCQVDVDDLRREADSLELQALRNHESNTRKKLCAGLYAKARRLRAQADAMLTRMAAARALCRPGGFTGRVG